MGVKGKDIVVLGCEKRSAMKLQDTRITPSKIGLVDTHVALAFAGLNADARILVDRARLEAQSHRLTVEDPVSIEYITKYIAGVQQRYTQSGGVRPFGISTLIVGFDPNDKTPRLYQTEPSGIYSAWSVLSYGNTVRDVRADNLQESKCYRAIKQDGARVPRAKPQGRPGPGRDDQADGQVAARGSADGREEHRDCHHGARQAARDASGGGHREVRGGHQHGEAGGGREQEARSWRAGRHSVTACRGGHGIGSIEGLWQRQGRKTVGRMDSIGVW